ncbi:MAG: transglutaminase N-terminal domain-containing protein [Steroidobacteraceae bacterium]
MSVWYQVEHLTRYDYSAPVVHAHHLLHLTPREHPWQKVLSHHIEVLPVERQLLMSVDAFGNQLCRLELDRPHELLSLTAYSQLQLLQRPLWVAAESLSWERVRDELTYCSRARTNDELEAVCYRTESPHIRIKNVFADFAADCFPRGQPLLVGAEALKHKIFHELTYSPGTTEITTSLLEVLETRRGVCQDFSHLMIACLRSLGLSARYVSGYLRTRPPENGEALVGADASHAWVSVYVPPFGWVDLDPTNDLRVATEHITLGWGRDFSDVSPVRGVIVGGGSHKVDVAVTVSDMSAVM